MPSTTGITSRPRVPRTKPTKAVPTKPEQAAPRDTAIVRALSRWFLAHQRDLPWREVHPRTGKRDAYRSLVSELMLQQTQVSRVLEKFGPFLDRFPTVFDLAAAPEDDVMAAWTGLGYYRRARLLHAAAKAIVERHNGRVPETTAELEALPGIGRYTAGALASMAHGQSAALVDTNVVRVLLRVEGKDLPAKDAATTQWIWTRAEQLVHRAHATTKPNGAGVFNEAMMELGALVCVSGTPKCDQCPLAERNGQPAICIARAKGIERTIPRAAAKKARTNVTHVVVVVRDAAGKLLMERRSDKGLWAGLWQCPTLEVAAGVPVPTARALIKALGLPAVRGVKAREEFVFHTTHRAVRFVVYQCLVAGKVEHSGSRKWVTREAVGELGMSSPMLQLLQTASA